MKLIDGNFKFAFNYAAYDQASNLYVAAKIYDVSTGTPSFISQVTMTHTINGSYYGTFTGTTGKTYLVITLVFTNSSYNVVDTDRAPGSEVYQAVDDGLLFVGFEYASHDHNEDLFLAGNLYDVTSGTNFESQIEMDHVANGVYFGSFTPTINHTYVIEKSVYTDGTYASVDPDKSPGLDDHQSFDISGSGIVVNNVFCEAVLVGQDNEAVLEGVC